MARIVSTLGAGSDVAYWPIADIVLLPPFDVCLWGMKQTWLFALQMSANDPKWNSTSLSGTKE